MIASASVQALDGQLGDQVRRIGTEPGHLDVDPSNASRTCDQFVTAGRNPRQPEQEDRSSAVLQLNDEGTRLLASIMTTRRLRARQRVG